MKKKNLFSRRNFVKTGILTAGGITMASGFTGCNQDTPGDQRKERFSKFEKEEGVSGVLFSQLGYEPDYPVRVIIRLPKKELLQGKTICRLLPVSTEKAYETDCNYFCEIWKSHWWVAEFRNIDEQGEWNIQVINNDQCVLSDSGLRVGKNILWDSTVEWSSVDMLERRRHFTKVGAGWQDAGTLWVESPAQSAMIISLCELLEHKAGAISIDFAERIYTQLQVGCDYLVMTQDKATELGNPKGSFTHDLHGHEKDILPNDAMKAVIALAKTSRLLPGKYEEKKQKYAEAAKLGFQWLLNSAKPMGDYGYMRMQRGLPNDAQIPKDEWLTRDLLTLCWASVEMNHLDEKSLETAAGFAQKVMERQIVKDNNENGYYGHFYEFSSMKHSEPSWVHGIVPSAKGVEFGADIGGIYPNYLLPLIKLLKNYPEHKDAEMWKQTLVNFTYGYLIPACEQNPFYLVPQGIFGNEGAIWFCGTFHGTNAIYGYTAALALELAKLLNEPKLKDIAYGNLQWLAGLNAGITRDNLALGCVVFSTDLPKNVALPASMICHIGNRWAGTWFQTRGVICNGFSTGKQFVYDVEPKKVNDGPFSLTDEDWIPHSAGWLTGLMRLA